MLSFLKMLLTPEFFFSILRISAPILFATLGAIVVEKAGFCNIGLEGLMMSAALTGSLSYYAQLGLGIACRAGHRRSHEPDDGLLRLPAQDRYHACRHRRQHDGLRRHAVFVQGHHEPVRGQSMASSTGLITSNLLIPNITIPLLNKIPFLGGVHFGAQPADLPRLHHLRLNLRHAV